MREKDPSLKLRNYSYTQKLAVIKMTTNIFKGSDWIKCDLHIHTPESFFHVYGDKNDPETWEKFISDLEVLPSEFKIIGINDYLTIEGYKKVLEYKRSGRLANISAIFPVIEFRLDKFAGENKLRRINYHVIFSDELSIELIQSQFLNAIHSHYCLDTGSPHPTWSAVLTDESLEDLGQKVKTQSPDNTSLQAETDWDVGFNNFCVKYDELKNILNRPQFEGKVVTAIGKSEWGDYRWNNGGAAEKRNVINEADLVFTSTETPETYQSAKNKLAEMNVNSRLLDCSDAHYLSSSEQKDRIGNSLTWLKIEPTFSGLKQILFESEYRIHIGETHPDNHKMPYQIIDKVEFHNGDIIFTDSSISLSPSLNAIIGGKSTGKSLLAGLIVKSSDPAEFRRKKGIKENELNWVSNQSSEVDFFVHWKDGVTTSLNEEGETRKITYFPQHYLNSKVGDTGEGNKELNKLVRNILSQTERYKNAFTLFESNLTQTDQKIANDARHFENKLRELRGLRHTVSETGKASDIQNNIDVLNEKLNNLKSQYGLLDDEMIEHKQLSSERKEIANKAIETQSNLTLLSSFSFENIKDNLSVLRILGDEALQLTPSIMANIQNELADELENFASKVQTILKNEIDQQTSFKDGLKAQDYELKAKHTPILDKIKKSAPLKEMNEILVNENEKLEKAKELEGKIEAFNTEIGELSQKLRSYLVAKKDFAAEAIETIASCSPLEGDEQLHISADCKCKAEHLRETLKGRIKYKSNNDIKQIVNNDDFDDSGYDVYTHCLNVLLKQACEEDLELKGEHKIASVIEETLTNAIYLSYDLKLGEDSFSIMSPGKRALVLLRVLIELDQSQHPIVLDQPEDDLDNRSVYEGLATYLKRKKLNRQIIVVTHNPNVVVGADSEYVIVANQTGQEINRDNRSFKFEYMYGGLENSFEKEGCSYVLEKQGIRQHVCEILDGGDTAFKRREQLYSSTSTLILSETEETFEAA